MATLQQIRVHLALLLPQLLVTSCTIVAQRLLVAGMNQVVYSFYCTAAGLVLLGPLSYFAERDFRLLIFSADARLILLLNGLLYFLGQILLTNGIKNTSANFCTAMQPSVPVFGAVFALLMRVEKLNWPRVDGQAKVGGILLCSLGATLMAVWQGPRLFGGATGMNLLGSEFTASWTFGALCILLYCIGTSLNGCLAAMLLAKYPKAPISILAYGFSIGTVFLGLAGTLQGSAAWKLPPTLSLLATVYNGLTGVAVGSLLVIWSIGQVGPILAACYSPVQPLTSLAVSSAFFGASVYLGSVVGGILVVAGLLLVSWSKAMSIEQELEQLLL